MELLEKVVAGVLIGILTYILIVPFVHELGHYYYALVSGWTILEFNVSFPALIEPSFVSVLIPLNTPITLFLMAGSWNTLIWGFLISLLPIVLKYHYIFLSIGYGMMSDALIYPIYDSIILQYGDWWLAGLIPSILTVGFFFIFLIFSISLNNFIRGFNMFRRG